MLDINLYRENESIAMRDLDTWQKRSRHALDVFEKANFPVRVNNISLLRQVFSTMSEGLFEYFMKELGGLGDDELSMFLRMADRAVKFQATHFADKPQLIPFENLLKDILIFSRIKNIPHKNILEIGPGCGTFAYIFCEMPDVTYHQVEVCESFYMLNHYQNTYLFGREFEQFAAILPKNGSSFFVRDENRAVVESLSVNLEKSSKRCAQYPWWRLGDIARSDMQYDIVMSHANLMEFSHDAFCDYLALAQLKVSDEGFFVVNCFGNPSNRNNYELFDILYSQGFAPLYIHHTSVLMPMGEFKNKKMLLTPAGDNNRALACDEEFKNKFSEVFLLDDRRAGETIGGCKVLSREQVDAHNFDFALINSQHYHVEQEFKSFLKTKNIPEFDGEKVRPAKSWGIFVGKKHSLHAKYYDRQNFQTYFDSNESVIEEFFSANIEGARTFYTKEQLLQKINKYIH